MRAASPLSAGRVFRAASVAVTSVTIIPPSHRDQGVAQRIAQRDPAIVFEDIRVRTAIRLAGSLGDEIEHHERVARPRRDIGDPLDDLGEIETSRRGIPIKLRRVEQVWLVEHIENLADPATM
jgi:hypothetical protein